MPGGRQPGAATSSGLQVTTGQRGQLLGGSEGQQDLRKKERGGSHPPAWPLVPTAPPGPLQRSRGPHAVPAVSQGAD